MSRPAEADFLGGGAEVQLGMLHPSGASTVGMAGRGATATLPAPSPTPDAESPQPDPESSAPPAATSLDISPPDVADVAPLEATPPLEDTLAGPKAQRRTTALASPASSATHRPAPASPNANPVRTRCLSFGGLIAMVGAVVTITAATLGSSTPTPAVSVAAKIPVPPRYWIVRPGQTLISIAAREGLSPSAVRRANPSLVGRSLESGQRVRLPG